MSRENRRYVSSKLTVIGTASILLAVVISPTDRGVVQELIAVGMNLDAYKVWLLISGVWALASAVAGRDVDGIHVSGLGLYTALGVFYAITSSQQLPPALIITYGYITVDLLVVLLWSYIEQILNVFTRGG